MHFRSTRERYPSEMLPQRQSTRTIRKTVPSPLLIQWQDWGRLVELGWSSRILFRPLTTLPFQAWGAPTDYDERPNCAQHLGSLSHHQKRLILDGRVRQACLRLRVAS